MSAAWVRIRREELDRHAAALRASHAKSSPGSPALSREQIAAAVPTHKDTAELLLRRLRAQEWNPTRWNWSGMAEQKERSRWGIVEPGTAQRDMIEEMNRK